jgi:cytochrome d ubiquinol oxidase subunit II
VHERARALLARALPLTLALMLATTVLTALVQPRFFAAFARRPWAWPLPAGALAALVVAWLASRRGRERTAFLGSCAFLVLLLAATTCALHPILLRSTVDPAFDLVVQAAASGHHGLRAGLAWWLPSLMLAAAYFAYLFRSMRGKVQPDRY